MTCSIGGCEAKVYCRGWCHSHYDRHRYANGGRERQHRRVARLRSQVPPSPEPESVEVPIWVTAYVAGLVDGEGYVGIKKRMPGANKMRSPKYSACLTISMTKLPPIEFVKRHFSVTDTKFRIQSRARFPETHAPCFVLEVENDDAVRILTTIRPYLLLKGEQAGLACELRRLQRAPRHTRQEPDRIMDGGLDHPFTVVRNSDAYLAQCEALYQRCLELNHRGAQ